MESSARLEESFVSYRSKITRNFEYLGNKGENYHFRLKLSPQYRQRLPGYEAVLTVTARDGRVAGQSMLFRLGENRSLGATLATLDAFAFSYESIGKPKPMDKKQSTLEFTAFAKAVEFAFKGSPQTLKYPGFPGRIYVSSDKNQDLIVAAVSDIAAKR